jgi:putative ABC transport system ATP-binding protein
VAVVISLRNVSKTYDLGTQTIEALKNVNLDIHHGDFITIQGPSGCGKTTLLNIIGLIDDPSAGEIFIDNRNIVGLSADQKADLRKETPIIFQFYNLIDYLTARDNVSIALAAKGIKNDAERKREAEKVLTRVGLAHRFENHPEELSGGEQQRVAIARAMVVKPRIILADEPTGDLDRKTGTSILELFQELNREFGYTFLIVTHDPFVANMGKRRIVMEDYQIKSDSLNESS